MKKYLFGLIAVVFALCSVAFITPSKSSSKKVSTLHYFIYQNSVEAGITTPANWTYFDAVEFPGVGSCENEAEELPCVLEFTLGDTDDQEDAEAALSTFLGTYTTAAAIMARPERIAVKDIVP